MSFGTTAGGVGSHSISDDWERVELEKSRFIVRKPDCADFDIVFGEEKGFRRGRRGSIQTDKQDVMSRAPC